MKAYYRAEEAMKKLDLPKSTFHQYVREGRIPKIILPLRTHAVYPKKEIDRLVQEKAQILTEYEEEPERLTFIVPNLEELRQLIDDVDRLVFHEETLIMPEEQQKWLLHNPQAIHILKDTETNSVVGGITISPLRHDALEMLLNLEIDETQLKPEDFQPYIAGSQDCYVIGIVAKPGLVERYYASRLLHAALAYLIELLEHGVVINRIYTVAGTEDGDRIANGLHFLKLPGEKQQDHECRHPYVLDLNAKNSKSKLVSKYLKYKRNRERRQKRHEK
ncbi:MAG: helix-turn-helix domain-containing protein [Ktedonobacteraceae bacterium]|nr:helix-turn-helix domain-containing protein [Ktedonobacteraceae bacterium]